MNLQHHASESSKENVSYHMNQCLPDTDMYVSNSTKNSSNMISKQGSQMTGGTSDSNMLPLCESKSLTPHLQTTDDDCFGAKYQSELMNPEV